MKIEELRGVTRAHLTSYGDDYDVFLEVCHGAEKKDFPDAFAVNGHRYVVVNTETGEEFPFMFASHVEYFLAHEDVSDLDECLKEECPECGGAGEVGYDTDDPQTCPKCGGEGFLND